VNESHTDVAGCLCITQLDRPSTAARRPRIGEVITGKDLNQSGFTGAILPNESMYFTMFYGQVDAAESGLRTKSLRYASEF
jgi:hypothetical protein